MDLPNQCLCIHHSKRSKNNSSQDILTLKDTQDALNIVANPNNKIDVLFMNACSMGTFEVGYQFRDTVTYFVGSQDYKKSYTWGFEKTLNQITTNSSPLDVAKAFVDGYVDQMTFDFLNPYSYTMSVVDLSKAELLKEGIELLIGQISSKMENYVIYDIVYDHTLRFPIEEDDELKKLYMDLYHFTQNIRNASEDEDVDLWGQYLLDIIDEFVVYNRTSYGNSNGVSLFFPNLRSSYYTGDNNDFAAGTIWNIETTKTQNRVDEPLGWGNFLVQFFEEVDPGGPDNPDVPDLVPEIIPEPTGNQLFLPFIIN